VSLPTFIASKYMATKKTLTEVEKVRKSEWRNQITVKMKTDVN
jgi:hypothetical protein